MKMNVIFIKKEFSCLHNIQCTQKLKNKSKFRYSTQFRVLAISGLFSNSSWCSLKFYAHFDNRLRSKGFYFYSFSVRLTLYNFSLWYQISSSSSGTGASKCKSSLDRLRILRRETISPLLLGPQLQKIKRNISFSVAWKDILKFPALLLTSISCVISTDCQDFSTIWQFSVTNALLLRNFSFTVEFQHLENPKIF